MARSLYAGRLGDTVVAWFVSGGRRFMTTKVDATGAPAATVLQVYDVPGGTHLTDLMAVDPETLAETTPIAELTVPWDGQIPPFKGPDGYSDDLWLLDPDGDWYRMDVRSAVGPAGPTGPTGPAGSGVASVNGDTGPAVTLTAADVGAVPTARTITAGTGLTGGGDLSANRTLTVAYGTTGTTATVGNDSRVTGAAQKASNLSDLASASTARANIEAASSSGGGREKSAALSATTGTCTGDIATASIFTITPSGNWTLAFSNVPATGTGCTVTVIVTEGATPRTMTQPSGVTFVGTAAPSVVASKIRVYTYLTVDGGTTWIASAAVQP